MYGCEWYFEWQWALMIVLKSQEDFSQQNPTF